MIPILVVGALTAASYLLSSMNRNRGNSRSIALNAAPLSSNVIGQPWPDLYGEFKTSGTILAWTGSRVVESGGGGGGKGFGGSASAGSSQTYYRTFALGLCIGPVDAINAIYQNTSLIWSGYVTRASANADGYTVLSTSLGNIRLYWGGETQNQDAVVAAFIATFPSFRGFCYAVFDDFQLGSSDSLPPLEIFLRRYPSASPGATAGTAIGVGANPIYRAYELLTDTARGVAMPAAWLDAAAFAAAAGIVETGLSDCVTSTGDLKTSLEDILGDIDAALIIANGQFKPVLLRDRAVDVSLAADDIIGVERCPSVWWEQPTQANIKFLDRTRRDRDNTIPLYAAGSAVRDDKVIDIVLTRCTEEAQARMIGARKLAFYRRALLPQTVTASRAAAPIEAGDVISCNSPAGGLAATSSWRVVKVEDSNTDEIKLTIVDDVFSNLPVVAAYVAQPAGIYVAGGQAGGAPASYPLLTVENGVELPFDISGAAKRICLFAARVSDDAAGFTLYGSLDNIDYDTVLASAPFHAGGTLISATWPRYAMDRKAALDIASSYQDLAAFSSLSDTNWFALNMLVVVGTGLDAAVFSAREIFLVAPGRYRITGLFGPLSDTVASAFAAGAPVFLFRIAPKYSVAALPGWTNGSTLYLKAVPYGARTSPELSAITAITVNITNRASRPLPAINLLANNSGTNAVYSADLILSWIVRTRGNGACYDADAATEVDSCDVEICVGGSLKRTITAAVKHAITTTTLAGAPTATQFDVADATGLAPGYRVGVTSADGIERSARIASIDGSTVALFGGGLRYTPAAGDTLTCREQVAAVYASADNVADNGALAVAVNVSVYPTLNGLRALRAAELEASLS